MGASQRHGVALTIITPSRARPGLASSQARMAEAIDGMFNDSSDAAMAAGAYRRAVEELDTKTARELDAPYRATVLEPIGKLCSYFPEINKNIEKRNKKVRVRESRAWTSFVLTISLARSSSTTTPPARSTASSSTSRQTTQSSSLALKRSSQTPSSSLRRSIHNSSKSSRSSSTCASRTSTPASRQWYGCRQSSQRRDTRRWEAFRGSLQRV